MSLILDRAVYLEANGLNKSLNQAIVDGDIGAGGGGGGSLEVFNAVVQIVAPTASSEGISYFISPASATISFVKLMVWDKNGVTTGNLTIDIKKNTSPNPTGMTSIFSVLPTLDFATASNYDSNAGTLSTSAISVNDVLRLDVTSIPSGFIGYFSVTVFA
jgi:hypothetical protein